ncbi:MAG: hypothetical protein QOF40_3568, partial [Actinomycetota bacterium]|nr:hypothetical protein [Actinomycetota bacterium]
RERNHRTDAQPVAASDCCGHPSSETRFEASFQCIGDLGLSYWADPRRTRPGEVAQRGRGRAFYFADPSGHFFEVLTRPEVHEEAA